MRTEKAIGLFCLLFLLSCQTTVNDMSKRLDLNYPFAFESRTLTGSIIINDAKDDANIKSAKEILKAKLLPIKYTITYSDEKISANADYEVEECVTKLEPDLVNNRSFKSKTYFLASANVALGSVVPVSSDAEINSLYEYILNDTDMQFSIQYVVNPYRLFNIYYRNKDNANQNEVVLFTQYIYAPQMFYLYEMSSASLNTSFLSFVTAKSSIKTESAKLRSNRFILREYNQSKDVKAIINVKAKMFEEVKDAKAVSKYGDVLNIDENFLIKGPDQKYYTLSREYRNHLINEGVKFYYPNPAEAINKIVNSGDKGSSTTKSFFSNPNNSFIFNGTNNLIVSKEYDFSNPIKLQQALEGISTEDILKIYQSIQK